MSPAFAPISICTLQVVKALVTLYHDFGQSGRAIEMLEEQLAKHYASVDLTHINMLADLYMAMVRMGPSVQVWSLFVICSGLFVGFGGLFVFRCTVCELQGSAWT